MQVSHLFSRSALMALTVVFISLLIAIEFNAEDPNAHVSSTSPQPPLQPADLMSVMQGKLSVDRSSPSTSNAKESSSSSSPEKKQAKPMAALERPKIAKDAEGCKVICQRFGMSALGGDFVGMNVGDCCDHCDAVFKDDVSLISDASLPSMSKSQTAAASVSSMSDHGAPSKPALHHPRVGLSLREALRQMVTKRFTRSGVESISLIAVVMIVLLVLCTCVGALSVAYPHKFPLWGENRYSHPNEEVVVPALQQRQMMLERKWPPPSGQGLSSALSPFASALMPTPVMSSDLVENASETEAAAQEPEPHKSPMPPPLCPTLVMPVSEARFGVPMFELAEVAGEGEVTIVGLSGNPLLRGVVRRIGNARTLEISMPEQNSAPRATITPSMMELAGHSSASIRALEIRGMRGSFYGTLEMRSSGACYVMRDGQAVLTIDGDADSLQLSIKSSVGLQLASVRCSAEAFGGVDHVEIRVEPGVDTVLVLAVVLAVLLLSPYLEATDDS